MINIRSDEGHFLDYVDSENVVKQRILQDFHDFQDICSCKEILKPDYWGDCETEGTIDEYIEWIKIVAQKTFK